MNRLETRNIPAAMRAAMIWTVFNGMDR